MIVTIFRVRALVLAVGGIMGVSVFGVSPGANAEMTVWTENNLTRVRPFDEPKTAKDVVLAAARGEYASFQIVVRAPGDAGLETVNVVASDLVGPGTIGAELTQLFREHYVTVEHSTPRSPLEAGRFPDALIPFVHPDTGEPFEPGRFPTAPFPVEKAENQPVWGEILVPRDAEAGTYTGQLTVSAAGEPDQTIDVELVVWDFELPVEPTLATYLGSFRGLDAQHGVGRGSEAHAVLRRQYVKEMLEHRMQPSGEQWRYDRNLNKDTGGLSCSSAPNDFTNFFDTLWGEHNLNMFSTWPWSDPLGADRPQVVRYLRGLMECFDGYGFADRGAYLYTVDEPNNAEQYEAVRAWAAIVEEADPRIRLLVTEQPWPTEEEWGSLTGDVDIWVALFVTLDDPRTAAAVAAGEEVWGYPALAPGSPLLPHWQLDYPIINYRSPTWLAAQSGLSGLLYWQATFWQDRDPWTETETITYDGGGAKGGLSFNGDGVMIYPGSAINYDGPVMSMRLKVFRDGMQDWEYIEALRVRGLDAEADAILAKIGRDWIDWSRDPADYYQARAQAAELIQRHDKANGRPSQ